MTFNQNWQNMNTFWDLVEAVNRPPYGSHSVRELVQLLHYYYIILQELVHIGNSFSNVG